MQKPLNYGADCVVYSTTKHIDGQAGVSAASSWASREFIDNDIHPYLRHTGPALSPFNAWVMLKSLETLPLRVDHQAVSAARIADFLAGARERQAADIPGRADHPQAASCGAK